MHFGSVSAVFPCLTDQLSSWHRKCDTSLCKWPREQAAATAQKYPQLVTYMCRWRQMTWVSGHRVRHLLMAESMCIKWL